MRRIRSGRHHTRFEFGTLTMTSLCDGFVDMPTSRLRRIGDRVFGDDLPPRVRLVDGNLRLSVNAFALDDGGDVVLFDTGAADVWHPSMGRLPDAVREAGIEPERVRTVAFTHTHLDHIHGLILPGGNVAFPRLSRLLVPRAEMDMFRAVVRLERFHDMAEAFDDGDEIARNVNAIAAPGHEVGHTCFRATSAGETVLIWGDIIHVPSIQFEQPDIAWEFDRDQTLARASRIEVMSLAADNDFLITGAHLDAPGVGRIIRSGAGFSFCPL
ncbi:MAG: MBL fold metallo-hydrolase [Rhizobiales bacterium]|nr:MBL fold metallo-hydrolase [Hyphomicrobiales bacterium]